MSPRPSIEHGRTPIEAAIVSLSDDVLLKFLGKQRWFGSKGATATSARVVDFVAVPWGLGAFAIARVDVESHGETRRYQLPLAARDAAPPRAPETAVVSRGDASGKWLIVYDALYDPDFLRGLARAVQSGTASANTSESALRLVVDHAATGRPSPAADADIALVSAEQSNSSLIIGDTAILKLFRTLNPGVHPDVEVTRFLTTRARFKHTPALLAELRLDEPSGRTTSAVVQEYLAGASDAWSYALERGRSYFTAPADREGSNDFIEDSKRLGAVTRALHDALAGDDDDPAFSPEPATSEDLDRWAHRAQQSAREALALLERRVAMPGFPRDRVNEAQALVKRRDHYLGWINEIADTMGDDFGMKTRTHGDYHLGQVLRTRGGEFMIIDFEGEPARSLEERREKTSPLRDVAGMLRSIAYAAATLATTDGRNALPHVRELRTARWERDIRAAYLDGYFEAPDDEGLYPEDDANRRQLIALFETEKAFYELAYELNNRPAWAWIPMRGISKLFVAK